MDDFDRRTTGARLPGPDSGEDIQDEPTAVRPRASSPFGVPPEPGASASFAGRAEAPGFMLGLPALTAPPSNHALADVAVHVTPVPPSANFLALPDPSVREGGLPHLMPRVPPRSAERARAVGAARVLMLLCGGMGFAVLGILADRSGLLAQLGRGLGDASAQAAAPLGVAVGPVPTIATQPLPTTEALAVKSAPDVEASIERAREVLGADADKAALLDTQALLLRALKLEPANPHVRACLGQLYLRLRMLGPAYTEASEAVRLRPRRARYRVLLGDVFRALGRNDDAEQHYARATEYDPQARAVDGPDAAALRATNAL